MINYSMKIQKQLSKKVKDKKYYKYVVVLKEKDVKEAGFKEGDELEAVVEKKGGMRLKKNG